MAGQLRSRDDVGTALMSWAQRRFGDAVEGFAEPPKRAGNGFDAVVWSFRFSGGSLDDRWRQRLAVRIPVRDRDGDRPVHQARMLDYLTSRGFAVPAALAAGGDDPDLGSFLVMEYLDGAILLSRGDSWRHFSSTVHRIADLHVRLHDLDAGDCPLAGPAPLVDRRIARMRTLAQGVDGDAAVLLGAFERHRLLVADETRHVLHNDVWGNVLRRPDGTLALLDWREAEIGDYHDDVARNINLWWLVPKLLPVPAAPTALAGLTGMATSRYRRRYAAKRPLHAERLHYWAGLQSLEFALYVRLGVAEAHDQIPPKWRHVVRHFERTIGPRFVNRARRQLMRAVSLRRSRAHARRRSNSR